MSNNKKTGCLYWLKKCFISEETDVGNEEIENDVIVINNIRQQNHQDELNKKIKVVEEKFIIETKIDKSLISSNEAYDENTRFNCPICLKYYNHILKLQCCENFICINCAEDYKTTQIKYEFNIKCPLCSFDKVIKLMDANDNEPNKMYSDSPIIKKTVKVEVRPSSSIINLQQ
jgi:DNA-directed RNA polymerase subunit RPC12/RpoP